MAKGGVVGVSLLLLNTRRTSSPFTINFHYHCPFLLLALQIAGPIIDRPSRTRSRAARHVAACHHRAIHPLGRLWSSR
jgi:hypothetical protein